MNAAVRMSLVISTALLSTLLAACPEDKPIDLSAAKKRQKVVPAARVAPPRPRPVMPEGRLPFALPVVSSAPTLALAPEIVMFDRDILRTPTSSGNPYGGTATPYVRPTSITPVGVSARLDDRAGDIALFVNRDGSALDTLYLLDDLKQSQIALAVDNAAFGQLPYLFGSADPSVRDRVQLDIDDDAITVDEESFSSRGSVASSLAAAIDARRARSSVGIEARLGVRAGTSNQTMVRVLEALAAAKVEAIHLVPVQDAAVHSSTGAAESRGGIPHVRIGQPVTHGDLDKAIIRRYIKRNIQKITYCYEKELIANAGLQGTLSTQFFIRADGKVSQSQASGVSPGVASCVAIAIRGIEFPKPKNGNGVQVNYPFVMRPDGG